MTIDIHMDTIKVLNRNSETRFLARLLLEEYGAREVTIDELLTRQGVIETREGMRAGITRQFLIDTFRQIQKNARSGKLIVGRKGRPTRWIWDTPFDIGEFKRLLEESRRRTTGKEEESTASNLQTATAPPLPPPGAPKTLVVAEIEHVFVLRNDYVFKFRLPADLTSAEADRIATMIRSLPIA